MEASACLSFRCIEKYPYAKGNNLWVCGLTGVVENKPVKVMFKICVGIYILKRPDNAVLYGQI
jgi:hypothetical protein